MFSPFKVHIVDDSSTVGLVNAVSLLIVLYILLGALHGDNNTLSSSTNIEGMKCKTIESDVLNTQNQVYVRDKTWKSYT